MPKAMRIHQNGGSEVLILDDVERPAPGPGQALIRHGGIGVNFIDIHTDGAGSGAPANGR